MKEINGFLHLNIPKDINNIILLFYQYFEWDKYNSHESLLFDKINEYTVSSKISDWRSGFSVDGIKLGSINWKIKIHDIGSHAVMIGVISNESKESGKKHFWKVADGFGWFSRTGRIFKQVDGNKYGEQSGAYSTEYKKGDIITVHLNADLGELSYSKNDKNLGAICWKLANDKQYHLAVALYRDAKLEFIE